MARCKGAQCKVKFRWYLPEGDYRVVNTDYSNYSVIYSCKDIFGVAKAEYVWILSRNEELSKDLFKEAIDTIRERIPWYRLENLYETKQGGKCKYLPVSYLEDMQNDIQSVSSIEDLATSDIDQN